MARNVKCRRICREPAHRVFSPDSGGEQTVTIQVDALEALRLCDLEGLDQDAAAQQMGVSRGTFQRILYAARKMCIRDSPWPEPTIHQDRYGE